MPARGMTLFGEDAPSGARARGGSWCRRYCTSHTAWRPQLAQRAPSSPLRYSRRLTSRLRTTRSCSEGDVSRGAWIDAAQRVLAGERHGIVCPVNGDGNLLVDWFPFETAAGGEFRLACHTCGETNFVLVRGDDSTRDSKSGPAPTPPPGVPEPDETESVSGEGCASDDL